MDDEVKTLAVKLALQDATFQQGMKNLRQTINLADSEFKAAGGTVKGFGETMDGVKVHAQALGEKISTQKTIIDQYKTKIQQTQADLQKFAETMQKNKTALEQTKKEYEVSRDTMGKNSEATKALKAALDEQTNAYKRSEAQVRNAQSSLNGYTIQMNEATGKLKVLQAELANTNGFNVISKNLKNIGSGIEETGEKISGLGSKMTTGLSLPIATAAAAIGKLNTDYQNGMAKISTIAETSADGIDKLGQGLIKISDDANIGLSDVQEAEYEAISSGVSTAKSLDYMAISAKAAKGGFTDVATAVDGSTTVLNAYNLSADHANDIYNQMIVAQNLGKTTLGQTAQSIGIVADTTANCNVNTQDLFSSLAVETAHGIQTSEAISGLRAALSNIIKPTDDAVKQAQALGLQFNVSHLKSVGWAKFLEEIADKTHGNTEEMGRLFGSVEGLNTMITLTSESGLSLFNESLQQMGSKTDYVGDAFDKVSNTKGAQFEKSLNEMKNSAILFGDEVTPLITDLTGGIKTVTAWLQKLTPEQRKFYTQLAEVVAIAGPSVFALGKITSGVGSLVKGAGSAVGAVGNFVKGVKGVETVAGEAVPTAMKLGSSLAAVGGEPVILALAAVTIAVVGIQAAMKEMTPYADELGKSLLDDAESWKEYKKSQDETASGNTLEVVQIENLYERLQSLVDANGKIVGSKQEVLSISKKLNDLTGTETVKVVGDEVQGYQNLKKSIADVISQKTAEIMLTNTESKAKEAESRLDGERTKSAQQKLEINKQLAQIQKDMNDAANLGSNGSSVMNLKIQQEKSDLKKMQDAYKTSKDTIHDYETTINQYQQASVAATQGNFDKVQKILQDTPLEYSKAKGATIAQLQDQAELAKEKYDEMLQDYSSHQAGISKSMVDSARDQAQKAITEYNSVGGNMVLGEESGINAGLTKLNNAGSNMGISVATGANSQSNLLTGAGKNAVNSLVGGLNSSLSTVTQAGKNAAQAFWQGYNSIGNFQSFTQNSNSSNPVYNSKLFSDYYKNKIGHNAAGTGNWSGGLTWVGEKGPELMNLPQGTQIFSSSESKKMVSQSGNNSADSNKWGADLMLGFAQGVTANQAMVIAAVSGVANEIHSYLHFSVPDKGALADADKYGLDFMQLLADTIDKNSAKPADATKKVAALVADRVKSIKDSTTATVKQLNAQLTQLDTQETAALNGKSKAQKAAIRAEYNAKKQAVKDQISMRKDQADKEISEIERIGKKSKEELQQEIADRKQFVSDVNSLNDEVKNALKEKYQQQEEAAEKSINNELGYWDNWKTQAEKNIDAVYKAKEDAIQSEIDALDKETAAQERANKHKEYTDKISDLQGQIAYSHDDYNKAQLQKQLASESAAYQKELDSEAVSDKKASLEQQKTALEANKQAELDSIAAIYNAQKTALENQLAAVKDTYSKMTADAALEAESEKLIMQNNQNEIITLLNSYSDAYKLAGQDLGTKLAEGFQPAIDNIKDMISSITAAISAARSDAMSALTTAQQAAATASAAKSSSGRSGSTTQNNLSVTINEAKSSPAANARAVTSAVQKLYYQVS